MTDRFAQVLRQAVALDQQLAESWRRHGQLAEYARHLAYAGGSGANDPGNEIELSPRLLGLVGLLYARRGGVAATVVADYIGRRVRA